MEVNCSSHVCGHCITVAGKLLMCPCLQLQAHSQQKIADMEALQQRFKAIVVKKDGSLAAVREQLAACQSRQGELMSELEQQKQQLLSLT